MTKEQLTKALYDATHTHDYCHILEGQILGQVQPGTCIPSVCVGKQLVDMLTTELLTMNKSAHMEAQ